MNDDCRKCNDLGETCRICQAENQESAWNGGFDMAITIVMKILKDADNDMPISAVQKVIMEEVEKVKSGN